MFQGINVESFQKNLNFKIKFRYSIHGYTYVCLLMTKICLKLLLHEKITEHETRLLYIHKTLFIQNILRLHSC